MPERDPPRNARTQRTRLYKPPPVLGESPAPLIDLGQRPVGDIPILGIDHTQAWSDLNDDVPLLLLPVRLETIFEDAGTTLKVRIYPDQVHLNGHAEDPTTAEWQIAQKFWARYHPASSDEEKHTAIDWLIQRVPARRAGWLARISRPSEKGGALEFPKVKTSDELTPARGACLPERWAIVGYLGGTQRFVKFGNRIPADLALAPDLSEAADRVSTGGELPVDEAFRWMVDFDEAVHVGMGLTIDLGPLDSTDEYLVNRDGWTLLAMGLADGTANENADHFEALLKAHHYTDGLSFVAQGTPTNNTDEGIAGWTADLDDIYGFFARELEDEGLADTTDADTEAVRLSEALGLDDARLLARVAFGGEREEASARAMNRVLWPVGMGQYLEKLLAPEDGESILTSGGVAAVYDWFVDHVRGGAPLPSVSIGAQPYGVLPVRRTVPDEGREWQDAWPYLESSLLFMREAWRDSLSNVPVLDPVLGASGGVGSNDAESDVATILSTVPHPGRFLLRSLFDQREIRLDIFEFFREALDLPGAPFHEVGANWDDAYVEANVHDAESQIAYLRLFKDLAYDRLVNFGEDPRPWIDAMISQVEAHWARQHPIDEFVPWLISGVLDRDAEDPRIFFAGYGTEDDTSEWNRPLVQAPDAEGLNTAYSYLDYLAERAPGRTVGTIPGDIGTTRPPLTGRELSRAGALTRRSGGVRTPRDARKRAMAGAAKGRRGSGPLTPFDPTDPRPGPTDPEDWLPGPIDLPGMPPTEPSLLYQLVESVIDDVPTYQHFHYRSALQQLRDTPHDVLELRLRETLGLSSHRLDAWFTGLARQRLGEMRDNRAKGVHVGGFGWVEQLRPDEAGTRDSQGFIHAPSLMHAATAAVLRSGWSTHGTEASDSTMAVDLRSHRMREASWLLDGIRQGQALGDLLGYRFERALHETFADQYIDDCRRAVLESQGRLHDPRGPVDGLALAELYRTTGVVVDDGATTVKPGKAVPAPAQPLQSALDGILASMDSVSDAGIVDSVHSMLQGNTARSSATLDALATGAVPPPELRSLHTPRPGTGIQNSVMVLLGDGYKTSPWSKDSPRSEFDPDLERLAAALLGDPSKIVCAIHPMDAQLSLPAWVSLEDLGVAALDVVFEAPTGELDGDSQWARRVRAHLGDGPVLSSDVVAIDFAATGTDPAERSFAEFAVLARAVRTLLGSSRPLDARDLGTPGGSVSPGWDLDGLEKRLDLLALSLQEATQEVIGLLPPRGGPVPAADAPTMRGKLNRLAAFGIRGDAKAVAAGDLAAEAGGAIARAKARSSELAALDSVVPAPANPPSENEVLVALQQRSSLLLGREFPMLYHCTVDGAANLFAAFADSEQLLEGDSARATGWLQRVAKVRAEAGRLDDVLLLQSLIDADGALPVHVAQPLNRGEPWLADTAPQEAGKGGMMLFAVDNGGVARLKAGKPVSGLLVDVWTELVPANDLVTGVAVHHDAPSSRPPQALLLVTPPEGESWSFDLATDSLLETFEFAKLRAVDPESLVSYGHHFPAVHPPGRLDPGPQEVDE